MKKNPSAERNKLIYYGKFGPNNTETHIADALEDLGTNILRIPLGQDLFAWIQPGDVVLLGKHLPDIASLRKYGAHTVCWVFDLYFNLPFPFVRSPEEPQFDADIVITTEESPEWAIEHYCIRQGIPKHHYYCVEPDYKYDVAFVGSSSYKARINLINHLEMMHKDRFIHVGEQLEYRGHDLNRFLATVKIVVGDSVPYPSYWSNRVYEITGRGGFLIHPEVQGLHDEFPDLPTFPYGDYETLDRMITFYLDNTKLRHEIRMDNFTRCGEFTYHHRAQQFIDLVSKRFNVCLTQ